MNSVIKELVLCAKDLTKKECLDKVIHCLQVIITFRTLTFVQQPVVIKLCNKTRMCTVSRKWAIENRAQLDRRHTTLLMSVRRRPLQHIMAPTATKTQVQRAVCRRIYLFNNVRQQCTCAAGHRVVSPQAQLLYLFSSFVMPFGFGD